MKHRSYIRNLQLRALYEHSQGCGCPSCSSPSLGGGWGEALADGGFDNRFRKIPPIFEEDFLKRLHGGKWKRNALDAPMWQQYYQRFRQFAEAGYGKTLDDPKDWKEFQLMEQLKRSASTFAGGKLATLTEELKTLRKLPKKDFLEAGQKVVNRHHHYLHTEVQTALSAAQSASAWQDVERRAYLYPNLKYVTAGDERVRHAHRLLDEVVYPVHHVFWDTHLPPNGWRCRCKYIQTDEPSKDVPDGFDYSLPKGFAHNPGKSGKLFADDHPYFNFDKGDLADIQKASEDLRAEWEAMDVYKLAQKYVNTTHKLPGMSNAATVVADFVSSTLSTATAERALRNDLLTYLAMMATQVKLVAVEGATFIYKVSVAGFNFVLEVTDDLFKSLK